MSRMDDIAREKKEFTPSSGFNLVGVDTFEDPGEQLYLIKHFTGRGEAETALKKRKSENEDEALHIYGSEEPVTKSGIDMDAIDQLEKAAKPAPKKTPHPVSEAQRRWAFAAEKRGELPEGKALTWSRRVKGEDLPASKATMDMLADVIDVGMVGKATDPPEKKEASDQGKDKKDVKPAFGKNNDNKGKDSKGQPPNGKPPQPGDKVEYPTKVEDPENPGEFTFEIMPEGDRSEEARFVVSDETPQGAHWEEPQHSEHYEHFKQWKSARKQGLEGTSIPQELVQGAMLHAGKHHFDAGPHKAAYDDHLAHQNANGAPKPPPSHHTVKNNNGSHQAMRSKDEKGKDKPNGKPPIKSGDKPDEKSGDKPKEKLMVGKMQVPRSAPDTEAEDVRTHGRARSGTERPAVGDRSAEIVDGYQELYGHKRDTCKSGDAIEQLDPLVKTELRKVEDKIGVPKKSEEGKPMHKQTGENYDLSKGLYGYDDRDGKAKDLPEAYLYDYLCGFIKEAIDSYDCRSKMKVLTAGEDIHQRAAQEVMFHLVQRMPKDKNLMRATKKYKVTQDGIANIIKEKNFIATLSDSKPSNRDYDPSSTYFSTDWDSMSAMGATEGNSPTGEVMVASQDSPWAQGSPGVKLADEPDRQPVQIEPGNPFGDLGELQKSKVNAPYQDQAVQPNMDNGCIIHGMRDLTKDQNFQNPQGTCTCKK